MPLDIFNMTDFPEWMEGGFGFLDNIGNTLGNYPEGTSLSGMLFNMFANIPVDLGLADYAPTISGDDDLDDGDPDPMDPGLMRLMFATSSFSTLSSQFNNPYFSLAAMPMMGLFMLGYNANNPTEDEDYPDEEGSGYLPDGYEHDDGDRRQGQIRR